MSELNLPPIRPVKSPEIRSTIIKPRDSSISLLYQPKKHKRRFFKIALLIFSALIIIFLSLGIIRLNQLSNKIFIGNQTSFFQKVKSIFGGGANKPLEGEKEEGQINILLLGIGGEGHDGPYLTDTIMLAQIRPDIGQIALTSIPRDYLVILPDLTTKFSNNFKNGKINYLPNNASTSTSSLPLIASEFGQRKINAVFSEGYTKKNDFNDGGLLTIKSVEDLTGLKIPYFAVVDFTGFMKAVDKINGLDVYVERTFTDYSFPNDKTYGFLPPVTFKQGLRHFTGEQALIFARSRHAEGQEGSDFARSQRQEKILQAFKDKILKLNLITNAPTLNSLLGIFAEHFHTNLTPEQILHIHNLVKSKGMQNFISTSLDPDTNLICSATVADTGAYVLVPCYDKTDTDVKNFFANTFSLGLMYQEKSVIWLGNSTKYKKVYTQAEKKLTDSGLKVWQVPYNLDGAEPLDQNYFYQVNPKPATAEFIKKTLNAKELTLPPTGLKIDKTKVDVIVLLGEQG